MDNWGSYCVKVSQKFYLFGTHQRTKNVNVLGLCLVCRNSCSYPSVSGNSLGVHLAPTGSSFNLTESKVLVLMVITAIFSKLA